MKKLILILLIVVLFAGCNSSTSDDVDDDNLVPAEPAMTIYNDSQLDVKISYVLEDDPENFINANILAGTEYEIEDGVKEVTITGGTFYFD